MQYTVLIIPIVPWFCKRGSQRLWQTQVATGALPLVIGSTGLQLSATPSYLG